MTDTNNIHLRGYAALTSSPYQVYDRAGSFMEELLPGCFKRTLNSKPGPDVVLNVGHGEAGSGIPLARTVNGTLRLEEDSRGLRVDADLDPVRNDAVELASAMRRGKPDVPRVSYSFVSELRKQRKQSEVDALGKQGKAFLNPDGHYSFHIESVSDLKNAGQGSRSKWCRSRQAEAMDHGPS